ncbi:MAG TPA: VTT domain-containing protein [Acetobacteraceae bacterium]|nr:VTT domain-containing protein [Acetobacteraceae bacterium]
MAQKRREGSPLIRLVLMAAGVVGAIMVIRFLGTAGGTEWVDRFVKNQGLPGDAIFLAIGIVATAAGVPRQAIAFLGGYAFGAPLGAALALAAQLGGGSMAYLWAREVGQAWAGDRLQGRYGSRLRPLQQVLEDNPFSSILALRLVPIGNNLALNLLAGVARVGFVPFLLASALGYLPQTIIFALLGEGLKVEEGTRIWIGLVLFVVASLIGFALLQRHRAAQVLRAEEEPRR